MNFLKNFLDLFIPHRCLHCKGVITKNHLFLCTSCFLALAHTNYLSFHHNPIEKLFWGQVEICQATALYHYRKKSPIQTLLKELKYNGLESFGLMAAKTMIVELKKNNRFQNIDLICIFPLHPKKERQRGYNQVTLFAKTIANYLEKPFYKDLIIKKKETESQTVHNKKNRFKNIANTFEINTHYTLQNHNILLIDDVLTTGATLISCCKVLKKENNLNLFVMTIACGI